MLVALLEHERWQRFLESDLAIIDKRRPKPNVSEVMNIIGDVNGRTCIIVDDIVDTANTLCEAALALKKEGCRKGCRICHTSYFFRASY